MLEPTIYESDYSNSLWNDVNILFEYKISVEKEF